MVDLLCADSNFWANQTRLICQSYQYWLGRPLISLPSAPMAAAQALFTAPLVVVSHNTAADPIFNYGNQQALTLFDMTWAEFTGLPSRCSAELPNREERGRLLQMVSQQGFIDDYRGVRITKTGRRFLIERATVWTLRDDQGNDCGQAASFSQWQWLSG